MNSPLKIVWIEGYDEPPALTNGRFYLIVPLRVPEIVTFSQDEEDYSILPTIQPHLAEPEQDKRLIQCRETQVIVDITDHPDCPLEGTTEAGNTWLQNHYQELDQVLRPYLPPPVIILG